MPATVQMQLGESWLRTGAIGAGSASSSGGSVSTPDAAALDIAGDIDIRIEVTPGDWTPGQPQILAAKWLGAGNQRSWVLTLTSAGALQLTWSADGSATLSATSSSSVGASPGQRMAVRATLDVDNGSGGRTATFYTAPTIGGSWTQLGSAVSAAGTTSIFSSSAALTLATCHGGAAILSGTAPFNGRIHGFELHSGIAGSRKAALDFTGLPPRATSVVDREGLTWTISGSSVVQRAWVDVPLYERTAVEISRGRSNEAAAAEPSKGSFELDNRTGDFSPRNPNGQYHGLIGRNVPVRIWQPGTGPLPRVRRPLLTDYAYCAHSASLSLTGDLDIRLDVDLPNWDDAAILIGKFLPAAQISWYLYISPSTHGLRLGWSTDGTTTNLLSCTAPVPAPQHGRKAVRITFDVDNGAGGKTATFYTAPTLAGPWTQLGAAVTSAGTTSIFSGTAEVRIGGPDNDTSQEYGGGGGARLYAAEIRNGIGGTIVASPDWTTAADGDDQLLDAQGNTWLFAGEIEITSRDDRFYGEAGALATTWDRSGTDVAVPVQAAGIMRRLGQGVSPLRSSLRRSLTRLGSIIAYWPAEDADGATSLASGLPGGVPMSIIGTPDLASFDDFACSAAIPQLKGSSWSGVVPEYTDTGEVQLTCLVAVPTAGITTSEQTLVRLALTGGTAVSWEVTVDSLGDLRLIARNSAGTAIVDTGYVTFNVNGDLIRLSVILQQSGANIAWQFGRLAAGTTIANILTGTLSSATVGRAARVDVGHEQVLDDVAIGHIAVGDTFVVASLAQEVDAWRGETAGARIRRLCQEEGIDCAVIGSLTESTALGYQQQKPLLELLKEAAAADGGILYEPRGFLGLAYRTRNSLAAQEPLGVATLTLNYADNQVSELQPVDDDTYTRNDIEITRIGGTSTRQTLDTGRLSTQAPPAGVGRYDEGVQLSLQTDAQTAGQASWRLHLGTVDEPRYPGIGVELARAAFAEDAVLTAAVRAVDVGDLVAIEDPPAWMPPETIRQIVQGTNETITSILHTVSWSGAPASAWDVGVYDDEDSRYSSQGSYLAAAIDTDDTSLSVRTPTGPVWGTADLPVDLMVGGERMTLTAVSGATSPQTFTVTRSVNGVAKAHREGIEVALFRPVYYAL